MTFLRICKFHIVTSIKLPMLPIKPVCLKSSCSAIAFFSWVGVDCSRGRRVKWLKRVCLICVYVVAGSTAKYYIYILFGFKMRVLKHTIIYFVFIILYFFYIVIANILFILYVYALFNNHMHHTPITPTPITLHTYAYTIWKGPLHGPFGVFAYI